MAAVIVPDASVLLKWAMRSDAEQDRDAADALKSAWLADDCELVVPTLWVFEVGNVLGLKQPDIAEELLASMLDLGLREEVPGAYLSGITALVRDYHVTFYDAAYHALAIHLDGTMLTADLQLLAEWPGRTPAAG
jgi:predicted nucleic acid-binding protein